MFHHIPSVFHHFTVMLHHFLPCFIISYHVSSSHYHVHHSTIMYHHFLPFFIICYHASSFSTMVHHFLDGFIIFTVFLSFLVIFLFFLIISSFLMSFILFSWLSRGACSPLNDLFFVSIFLFYHRFCFWSLFDLFDPSPPDAVVHVLMWLVKAYRKRGDIERERAVAYLREQAVEAHGFATVSC